MDKTINDDFTFESGESLSLEFRGNGFEYFKIVFVNVLLSILTLGYFSAWSTIRSKRYLCSNLYLDGDAFLYLGESKDLIKGRITSILVIASAILSLPFIPIIGITLSIIILAALPYVYNSNLQYHRKMTSFKYIRFEFEGSYWKAFSVFYLWPLLSILTLGILYPMALLKFNQYKVNNHKYADNRFNFMATYGNYGRVCLNVIKVCLFAAIPAILFASIGPEFLLIFVSIIVFSLIISTKMSHYEIFYNNLNLLDHRYEINITAFGLVKVILINVLLTTITLGLYLPAAKIRMIKYISSCVVMYASHPLEDFVLKAKARQVEANEALEQLNKAS